MAVRPEDFGAVKIAPNPEDFGAVPVGSNISWGDVPVEMVKNAIPSAGNFLGGIAQTVMHPIDTAGNIIDAAAGGLRNITPKPIANLIDKLDWNKPAAESATAKADAIGNFYKNRYGSMEGFKNTLATDPIGVAADASTVLAGGGALVRNAGGLLPGLRVAGLEPAAVNAGNAISAAGNVVNPMTPLIAAGKGATKLAGGVAKIGLGLSTGVGPENIANAAKAGFNGKTEFWDNLIGKAPMSDVIDAAKENLSVMKRQKSEAYRSGMVDISKDKTVLGFGGIDKAISEADKITNFKGQVTNTKAAEAVKAMKTAVDDWKKLNPSEYHTPEGLDALKQQLGGLLEGIPYNEKTARLAAGKVYTAAKGTITEQAPTYAKVMKNYSEASDTVSEIERALSLNPKASVDTSLRKLQSLTRNNVNSNYGNRLDLAKTLQDRGGTNIMPALSGQAMSSWTPRGFAGMAPLAAGGGAVMGNPGLLLTLPFLSPRVVGGTAYGASKAAGVLSPFIPSGSIATPGLLAGQGGILAEIQRQQSQQ